MNKTDLIRSQSKIENQKSEILKVLYFGTYRAAYVRNRLMIERLRRQGVEVVECHARLWRGLEDREQMAGGGWKSPVFWGRVAAAYARLIWRYLHVGDYDVMVVGYPGQPSVFLARLLSWLRGRPLVWDVLMSIYLIALERGLEKKSPSMVKMIRQMEGLACRLPDGLLIDTPVYAEWFMQTYGVPAEKVRLLPLGADDRVFGPVEAVNGLKASPRPEGEFRCLYYGTFIPNHGVGFILDAAARLLGEPDIRFELVGEGPERAKMQARAEAENLTNVAFWPWMPVGELVHKMAASDVILGTFGRTPQALMTMHNKIHEGLAVARPVVNGASPVMERLLTHGEHVYLCARESGEALADALIYLRDHPELCAHLARHGHAFYRENLAFDLLGARLAGYLRAWARGEAA